MQSRDKFRVAWEELSRQKPMVLLSGPRQSGKTFLAREVVGPCYPNRVYFNYDELDSKATLAKNPKFFQSINRIDTSRPLVILDEIHKYHRWKNYLKAVYDEFADSYDFLVTGSGRLESYQRGSDSLAGRYLPLRFWPFTIGELCNQRTDPSAFLSAPSAAPTNIGSQQNREVWEALDKCSGFPEPFLFGQQRAYTRWSSTYRRQLVYEDVREILHTAIIDKVATLFTLLPHRVGSPLSLLSLAEDISVSQPSVASWISVFESLFLTFSISPWHTKINRSIKKEKKVYLYDYAVIEDVGARFENMIALELLRALSLWNDLGYGDFSLHYLRNFEKQEVDFLVADSNKPVFMVEAKNGADSVSPNVMTFQKMLSIPAIVCTARENTFNQIKNGNQTNILISAWDFCAGLA